MAKTCYHCNAAWEEKRSPGFHEECVHCQTPLHCCCNCRFHDQGASQWCREPMARDSRPRDPERPNTCDYFLFNDQDDVRDKKERERKAREGLADLFGPDAEAPPSEGEKPDWMKMG